MAFYKKGKFHQIIVVVSAIWSCVGGDWKTQCIRDCTQQVGGSIWPCDIIYHDERWCSSVPLFESVDQDKLPSQPNISVSVYQDRHDSYSGFFPALNITVTVDLATGSSNLKGMMFILSGITDNRQFKNTFFYQEICRTYDLSAADTRWRDGVPRTVNFYYDCFKPLSPDSKYTVDVILLPVATTGELKMDSAEIRTPSCVKVPEFEECGVNVVRNEDDNKDEDNGSWQPQASSWGPSQYRIRTDYGTVYVSFDLPPPELKLNKLDLMLFKGADYVTNQIIDVAADGNKLTDVRSNITMVTRVFYNVTPGEHVLKVKAIPISSVVCDADKPCIVTSFPNFNVIADPCKSDPCGRHGNCSAVEESYICTCDGFSYEANGTCIHVVTATSAVDIITELQEKAWRVGVFVLTGCLTGVILLYIMWRFRKIIRDDTESASEEEDGSSNLEGALGSSPEVVPLIAKSPRILVIYSKDCKLHTRVVEAMCNFLRRTLGCDVISDFWEHSMIARKGLAPWLADQFRKSERILFVASEGTMREWDAMCSGAAGDASSDDAMFRVAMDTISGDANLGVRCERRGNYVCAYFPFASPGDVPDVLRNFGHPSIYEIPRQLKSMYMELLGLQENSALRERFVCEEQIQRSLKETMEGTALRELIKEMTNYVTENPTWYDDIHMPEMSSTCQEMDCFPGEMPVIDSQYREILNPIDQEFDV